MEQAIYIIDDDAQVRTGLTFLLRSMGFAASPYAHGRDFLESLADIAPGCVLLDMRMPEIDGMAMLVELRDRAICWPVIAITGHGDITLAVSAMKHGALDFLEKPIEEQVLSDVLGRASVELAARVAAETQMKLAQSRIEKLTAREKAVLQRIAAGDANKQIALGLGISTRTVEMHRENLIRKLGVKNGSEAATCAVEAGIVRG